MTSDFALDVDSNVVIEHVKAGMESAFEERGLSVPEEAEGFKDSNIKIQKLAYRVIEHFNIPVIRTWYRYGQFEPYGTLRPKHFSPQGLSEPDEWVPSRDYDGLTRKDIEGYFLELDELEKEWNEPLLEFLKENYQAQAEDDFREIYLANLGVLSVLEDIQADENIAENADQYANEVQSHAIDLWYEMKNSPYFSSSEISLVREFLDDLQMGLVTLAATTNPDGPQLSTIRKGYSIYHGSIWPLPAMQISIKEAKGPIDELNDEFLPQGQEYVDAWQSSFPTAFNSWQQQLREVGLVSGPTTYQSVRGKTPKSISELGKATLNSALDVDE